MKTKRTDMERLDFLDKYGGTLISDDGGRFVATFSGFGPIPERNAKSGAWTFLAKASEFRKGVRAAVDAAMLDAEKAGMVKP